MLSQDKIGNLSELKLVVTNLFFKTLLIIDTLREQDRNSARLEISYHESAIHDIADHVRSPRVKSEFYQN